MANATIGSLHVALGMDTAQFQAGAKRAQSTLAGLSSAIKGFAAGAIGALSLAGVTAAIKSSINHMDNLGKAAQKIGIPVEELSRLEYAGRLADVSLADLETSVGWLSKSLAEIQGGRENDAGAALKALGISATDSSGQLRSAGDIINDVADQFSGFEDGANKTAIAMALFGRSGAAMIPLLNGGADAIRAAGDEARRFGVVVDSQASQAAEEFNDNLTRLSAAGQGLIQQAITPMIGTLADLTEQFIDFTNGASPATVVVQEIQRAMIDAKQAIFEVSAVWSVLQQNWNDPQGWEVAKQRWTDAFDAIGDEAERNRARINSILFPDAGKISADGKGSLPSNLTSDYQLKGLAPALDLTTGSAKKTKTGIDEVARSLARLKDEGQQVWEQTRTPLEKYQLEIRRLNDLLHAGVIDHDTYGRAVRQLQDEFSRAEKSIVTLADTVSTELQGVFSSWIDDAVDGTFSLRRALGELAKDIAKMGLNNVLQGLFNTGGASGQGGGLFGSLLGGLFGGFSGFYAEGGKIPAGKWGIAGEAGPELIGGPATVIPASAMQGGGMIEVRVSLSDDLRAEMDAKVDQGMRQAVRVSVTESGRQSRAQFGANMRDYRVRQG